MVATEKTLPRRRIINTTTAFHNKYVKHWSHESKQNDEACRVIPTRFQQLEKRLQTSAERKGDELVQKVKDLFHNGMGIKWGDDQIRVFQAFLASCLPLIYGSTWAEEKTRVLEEWGLKRENMFSLVNMARRNGKTFVTSGTAAALLLCVPNIKLAIFSTCKRTSQMMMEAIMEMLERAFERGTHVSREDFVLVMKNTEAVCFKGPDGTKRLLSSLPGSVRVSELSFSPKSCVLQVSFPFEEFPSYGILLWKILLERLSAQRF